MNLEKRFIAIKDFLLKHQYLHEREVLERDDFQQSPYHFWAQEVQKLSPTKRITLENELDIRAPLSESYSQFLKQIRELCVIPKFPYRDKELPKELLARINAKKRHEISVIKQQLSHKEINKIIDIGSGAGHLSSVLLHQNNKESLCIDMSSDFQAIGKKKLTRHAPNILKRLQFETHKITDRSQFPTSDLLIGLHACGDLSSILIQKYVKANIKNLLSYGCCYHKLTKEHYNLSQNADLKLTNHSLTMAAKSYKSLDITDYQKRQRVKNFRYTLHFFMQEKLNLEFETIGNANQEDYQGKFSQYMYKYLAQSKSFSESDLEEYYEEKKNDVDYYIAAGIIRSHLARLVELYIILDRALFLKEKGFAVEVQETFSSKLSPRNISLFSRITKEESSLP